MSISSGPPDRTHTKNKLAGDWDGYKISSSYPSFFPLSCSTPVVGIIKSVPRPKLGSSFHRKSDMSGNCGASFIAQLVMIVTISISIEGPYCSIEPPFSDGCSLSAFLSQHVLHIPGLSGIHTPFQKASCSCCIRNFEKGFSQPTRVMGVSVDLSDYPRLA